jgi:hypothetical protein
MAKKYAKSNKQRQEHAEAANLVIGLIVAVVLVGVSVIALQQNQIKQSERRNSQDKSMVKSQPRL